MNTFKSDIADDRFNRARAKELWGRILNVLSPEKQALLSLKDMQEIIKSSGESYGGIKAIPIHLIVGSEGRYRDFSSKFLPRHESLRGRWTNVDRAHQQEIVLPAITAYEIGGLYFVRDGNHRVSVAKAMGMEAIDAEIISLNTPFRLEGPISKGILKEKVIEFERQRFLEKLDSSSHHELEDVRFSEPGRYDEITRHIKSHARYLTNKGAEPTFLQAFISWKKLVFLPIVEIISEEGILSRFRTRTAADLYVWIIKHGNRMRRVHRRGLHMREITLDLSKRFGKNQFQHLVALARRFLRIFGR